MKKSQISYIVILIALLLVTILLNRNEISPFSNTETPASAEARYLLAVSWQPAFCEQRPNRAECRSQRKGRFDSHNFSLHGLWPQPRENVYCGVPRRLVELDKSGRWRELPKLELSDRLRKELARKMPGYRSGLHRHEWYKHGTCMPGATAETYYRVSLEMLDVLNGSGFLEMINSSVNRDVRFRELEAAFVRAFGKPAAGKVILDCYRDDGRRIIQELKLSIAGDLRETTELSSLLARGNTVGRSCPGGIVDPVGQQ